VVVLGQPGAPRTESDDNAVVRLRFDGANRSPAIPIAQAKNYLSDPAKGKYGPVFDLLQAEYEQIMTTWSPPDLGDLHNRVAEYAIVTNKNNDKQVFLIYFLMGSDGLWRIDSL
jgi:hypothetical protein